MTQLVAFGADVQSRRLRLAAEAQARADAAAAISGRHEEQVAFSSRQHQAEIAISERQHQTEIAISERQHQTQIAITVRQRGYALDARARLSAQLVMWGADPQRRARLAAQARAASEAREAHLRVEIDLREHEEAVTRERREREETDRDHAVLVFAAHQRELAMSVRGELRTYLVSLGARERPPMPSPRPETPGMAPFDDASWIAGRWVWGDGQWSWETGGWHDPGHFSQTGGGEAGAHASAGVGIGFGSTDGSPGETPGGSSGGSTGSSTAYDTGVRDHRSTFVAPSTPTVRDHRDAPASPPQAPAPASTVRDHRSESSSSRKPDDKPKVRDHRR